MGHGTGFLCLYNEDKTMCGIATAMHVIKHADEWQQPIRIRNNKLEEIVFLKEERRFIKMDWDTDSAVIIFPAGGLKLPDGVPPLLPTGSLTNIGAEVAWLGFPAIEPWTLCFFSGNISAWQSRRKAYLIDGVAINGVSGGPVIYPTGTKSSQIVGIISAYQPNRAMGEALPGLSIAQDVSHFHDVINTIRSLDDAKKKKLELEKSMQQNGKQKPADSTPQQPPK
jgi:hypothetical protein